MFRDREDFSAAHDLSTAVKNALSQSQVLVVACSPTAKSSHWVNQEIDYFKTHHPERPILAAILCGKPEDVFPPALTKDGFEPLAANLCKDGDGWRLGFLKVVAGIANIPLDALIQRDSQRKLRRVIAVTGVVAISALTMSAMTIIALQARKEAERQWKTTQEFNAYFLSDFRDEMLAAGKLDVAIQFYGRIFEYCKAQRDNTRQSQGNLQSCARLMEVTGMDYERLGDFEEARRHYEEAFRTTEAEMEVNSSDPWRVIEHAMSTNRLGAISVRTKRLQIAKKYFLSTGRLLASIEVWGQAKEEWLRESAYTHAHLGALFVRQGIFNDEAREHLKKAIGLNRTALQINEGSASFKYDLTFHLSLLAEGELIAGNVQNYKTLAKESLKISEKLMEQNPDDSWIAQQRVELALKFLEIGSLNKINNFEIPVIKDELFFVIKKLIIIEPKNQKWRDLEKRFSQIAFNKEGEK